MRRKATPAKGSSRTKPGTAGPRSSGRLQKAIDDAIRREIKAALRETDGQPVAAAKILGISYVALWARMRDLGIRHKG